MRKRKPLPPIVKGKIDNKFIQSIYQEEVFDCIKRRIKPVKEDAIPVLKKESRHVIKDRILNKYSLETLIEFSQAKSKRKREISKLTPDEYQVLCYLTNDIKKKKRKNKIFTDWVNNGCVFPKKQKKKRKLKKHSRYKTYIDSKEWIARKNKYWKTHKRACAICGSSRHIHLHHMSYERLKNEPDEHLVALCDKHHKQYHKEHGVQRNMIRKTKNFIERERIILSG